jgi:hypothetical protein
MSTASCPNCREQLEGRKVSCGKCGWSLRKQRAQSNESSSSAWPESCEYRMGDLSCKYPAVASRNTRGGGPYYCRRHALLGDDHEQVCLSSQSYKPTVDNFDEQVRLSLQNNNMIRLPGEGHEHWIGRMRAFCRAGAAKLAGKR